MASVPPELLHLIVSQAALSYVYCPKKGEVKKDLGTLRSLRLANRKLSKVASEYLFEELTLYSTEASHAKMMAVAQHPTYSAYVRSIGISQKAIFGPFLDRYAFGQWFHQARPLVMCDGLPKGYFYVPHRMAYLPTKEARVIDFHHAEYTSLYKKQEQLFGKAGDLLKTAIGCFSHLELVEPSVRTPRTTYPVPSTDDAFISDLWQDSACFYEYDLEHSAMILTALYQGKSLAATQINISELFYKMDTMVMDLPDPVASGEIQKLVADAKKVNLSIQTSDYAGLQKLLNTSKCEKFLGLMKNLESLACSTYELQGSPLPYPLLFDIFGHNTWEHLHCLDLGRFRTPAIKLAKLLGRHSSTLEKLTLQHILLSQGSWLDIFIKVRHGALRVVQLHHLGCGNETDEFFDDVDALELRPIPSSHPLFAFLFREASWVPYMEKVLEGSQLDSEGSRSDSQGSRPDSEGSRPDATDWEDMDSEDDVD